MLCIVILVVLSNYAVNVLTYFINIREIEREMALSRKLFFLTLSSFEMNL